MPGISNSDLADLQKTTLENLPDLDFEVALDKQWYHAIDTWFRKDKIQEESGTSISRRIILDNSGNASHVRLYQKTALNQNDVQHAITAPWVQAQSYYNIERREALRNRKPAKFISLLQSRRVDAQIALANLLEDRAWLTPQNATDDLNPRGLPYWLTKGVSATTSTGDFNSVTVRYGDGTTSATDKGGLSPTTYPKWRSYSATYTTVNADLVKRMRRAFHATKFQAPILASDMRKGPASNFKIYMPLNVLVDYEDLTTKSNENIGADLDKFHGVTAFNRVPIFYAPPLDADAYAPIYLVNHAKFYPIVQEGDWLREGEPMYDLELHNVATTFVDSSYQYFCTNVREAGACIHLILP